jgi:hypothetical protein
MATGRRMGGSALHREDLFTDQAEAQVFCESAEDLTDFIGTGKHYLLDVVKTSPQRVP